MLVFLSPPLYKSLIHPPRANSFLSSTICFLALELLLIDLIVDLSIGGTLEDNPPHVSDLVYSVGVLTCATAQTEEYSIFNHFNWRRL